MIINVNPLQYSCLENPMDSGAWWATVYGVAESDTTEVAKYACTFFTVLEPGSPRSRHQQITCLVRACFLVLSQPACLPAFPVSSQDRRGRGAL